MGNKKHSNIPRLNFGSLNIQGGFLSKINLGDLSQLISKYDIFCPQETYLEQGQNVSCIFVLCEF